MTETVKIQKIYERIWKGHQELCYVAHYLEGEHTFKISIRRSNTDPQSYVRGYVLNGKEWSLIISEPITEHPLVADFSYIFELDQQLNGKTFARVATSAAHNVLDSLRDLFP